MTGTSERTLLTRLMWLSIAAALVTITMKTTAWRLTGSVGLLSDAVESLVNLLAAIVGLTMLRWAMRPPDEEHAFGHEKAEYFAAGAEGMFIMGAAASIAYVAVGRLLHPASLESVGPGLAVSVGASLVNLGVAMTLIRAGRRHRSITLEADGRHLMTDVVTSVGVVIGVLAVAISGWRPLDPIVAIAVAINIIFTGVRLIRRSGAGLMDKSLPPEELAKVEAALASYREREIAFESLRTRRSGRRSFVSVDVLVPASWTVARGHVLLEQIERDIATALPQTSVTTHLAPAPKYDSPGAPPDKPVGTRRARRKRLLGH
ncbi:MAG TPA: cation diffusion facilitator family transporter [Gaiellaceae bacterium]|jgi:cation diffusion facilitator family transporter